MNIFDVLTNGALGSVLDSITGGSGRSSSSGGLGGLGAGIGSVLDSLGKQAKSAATTIQNSTPGGLGGLAGAGALGAVLGNVLKGNLSSLAMAGAGAVAWNFYKKWAAQQNAPSEQEAIPNHPSQTQSANIPGFGDTSPSAALPVKSLDPTAALILRSMVYAARADGTIDKTEQERINTILTNMFPGENTKEALRIIREEGIDPTNIARAVSSPEQAEDVYRLSCSVIDVDHFMETSYLQALATALRIDPATKRRLEEEAEQAKEQLNALVNQ